MRTILSFLLCFLAGNIYCQEIPEKEIKSEIRDVTVFVEGAQITRTKTIDLPEGKLVLKFVNLSPFIDAKSIQVRTGGDIIVLSVNHQQNFVQKTEKPKELVNLELKLKEIDDKIRLENTHLSIIKEELAFLEANRDLGGKNQAISVMNLKEASVFYSTQLTALKLKEVERADKMVELTRQKNDIENQIRTLTNKKEFPSGEILLKVDSKKASQANFEISYIVGNAGWFPTYDIRAVNITKPLELIYKANVRQDTKEDWKNVKLKLSSSNPNISGLPPELKTYFMGYNTPPPAYGQNINAVKGRVFDQNQKPLLGVTVLVQGTTIGTITDVNGNYSTTLPKNVNTLLFSYVGYRAQTLIVTNPVMDVMMEEDLASLNEIVVVGYGSRRKSAAPEALQGRVTGVQDDKIMIRGAAEMMPVPTLQIERQTTVDFEIKIPYTINSDNKSYFVDMEIYNLPASYQYYCIPKIEKNVYLIAGIIDWEKYNLLEGEANIFFEDKFIGKTLLDVRSASDTLNISLGQDKNISVNREKLKDYTTKQFIGSNKVETRAWMTSIKNNKREKINILILDQVPVSTLEEIQVQAEKISGGKLKPEDGQIKWELSLEPNEKKDLELRYSVKYPRNRNLLIE